MKISNHRPSFDVDTQLARAAAPARQVEKTETGAGAGGALDFPRESSIPAQLQTHGRSHALTSDGK